MIAAKGAHQCNNIADTCFQTKRFPTLFQKKHEICQNNKWISNKELIRMSVEEWFIKGEFQKNSITPEEFEEQFKLAEKKFVSANKRYYTLGCGIVQTLKKAEKKHCSHFTCNYEEPQLITLSLDEKNAKESVIPPVVDAWQKRIDKVFFRKKAKLIGKNHAKPANPNAPNSAPKP